MHKAILKNLHRRFILVSRLIGLRKKCTHSGRMQVPDIPKNLNQASFSQLKQYTVYLMVSLRRFSDSPLFDSDDCHLAADRAEYIQDMLGAHPLRDDLIRTIVETENGTFLPGLKQIQEPSQFEVSNGH